MSTEPDAAPRPLVEALRKKVKHLEGELDEKVEKVSELEEDNEHLRNRIEKIEDALGIGGERF